MNARAEERRACEWLRTEVVCMRGREYLAADAAAWIASSPTGREDRSRCRLGVWTGAHFPVAAAVVPARVAAVPRMSVRPVAALYVQAKTIYRTIDGVDVWDAARDARQWPGGCPVVAHPPCRLWGRLAGWSNADPSEKQLALLAVEQVRANGGVLEHPITSTLWAAIGAGPMVDDHGGFLFVAPQRWWGHRAEKVTGFYIVGVRGRDLPPVPFSMTPPTHVATRNASEKKRRAGHGLAPTLALSSSARAKTPPPLAQWLVDVARRVAA